MRRRTVCLALLCCGPLLSYLGHNAMVWSLASPSEAFFRWGNDLAELPSQTRGSDLLGAMRQASCSSDLGIRQGMHKWSCMLLEEGLISHDAAAPILARGLRDASLSVRLTAINALASLGGEAVIPGYESDLSDPRWRALRFRLRFDLAAATRDCHWKIRQGAIYEIGRLGQDGLFALPHLEEALHDPNPAVVAAAKWVMDECIGGIRRSEQTLP